MRQRSPAPDVMRKHVRTTDTRNPVVDIGREESYTEKKKASVNSGHTKRQQTWTWW